MLRIGLILFLFPIFVFSQTSTRSFPKDISVDSTGKISICLSDSANETIYLECFRWNKWVSIDTIQRKISDPDTCISKPIENYSLEEQYRLVYKFKDGTIVNSNVAKYQNNNTDLCNKLLSGDYGAKLKLNCPSKWEIYDQYGVLVKSGNSDVIYLNGLPKGGYFLNYGNTTAEFFKQ